MGRKEWPFFFLPFIQNAKSRDVALGGKTYPLGKSGHRKFFPKSNIPVSQSIGAATRRGQDARPLLPCAGMAELPRRGRCVVHARKITWSWGRWPAFQMHSRYNESVGSLQVLTASSSSSPSSLPSVCSGPLSQGTRRQPDQSVEGAGPGVAPTRGTAAPVGARGEPLASKTQASAAGREEAAPFPDGKRNTTAAASPAGTLPSLESQPLDSGRSEPHSKSFL